MRTLGPASLAILSFVLLPLACAPAEGEGEGEGEEGEGEGEDTRTQDQLIDDVCAAFEDECGAQDCVLDARGSGLDTCEQFRAALIELDDVLSEGCVCEGGGCTYDAPYARATRAAIVCAAALPGAPFAERRGYRCPTCGTNDQVELCADGFAGYLNTDIVYSGAYALDGDTLTIQLEQIFDPLVLTHEEDDTLTAVGTLFVRDDTVELVGCP